MLSYWWPNNVLNNNDKDDSDDRNVQVVLSDIKRNSKTKKILFIAGKHNILLQVGN